MLGQEKITQPLRTKKSCNLLGQKRIGPNGSKLVQTFPKENKWVQIGHLGLNRSKWVQMGL